MTNLAGGQSRMMTKRTPSTMKNGGKTKMKAKKKMMSGGKTKSSGASAYGAKPKATMRSGGNTPMKRRGGKTKC